MDSTQSSKNKTTVLEAFHTLFNHRDYAAAETFWSPEYVQHSAYIAQGRKGFFELTKGLPATARYENALAVAEGDFVILHGRFTSALVEHMKKQDSAAILIVSSVLGFTPMAMTAVYSSTKAALHSYSQSLRFKLRHTPVRVLEIIPPWVRTELLNSSEEPRAMPLNEFVQDTMDALATDADEILVPQAKFLRDQQGPLEASIVKSFNEQLEETPVPE
jgi:NAD(P)-dependent dehydrogenase (short-subunit alcohol dehydrogenase family)